MLIWRIARAIVIVCARWWLFTSLAAIGICVTLFVTLLAQAGLEEYRREQQRVVQEETAEKAKAAERCAYLTYGTFTEADFREFTDSQSVLWTKANDPRGAFQGFIEDQCKWQQDLLAKAAAIYFDKYLNVKDLRHRKPGAAAQSLAVVQVQSPGKSPQGWVIEVPITVPQPHQF